MKNKNITLTKRIFYNIQNLPTFHKEERLVNLVRGRECFVGLSILIVYVVQAGGAGSVGGSEQARGSSGLPTEACSSAFYITIVYK